MQMAEVKDGPVTVMAHVIIVLAIRHVASRHFATKCSILGDKGLPMTISLKTAIGRLPSVVFRDPKMKNVPQYWQKCSPSPSPLIDMYWWIKDPWYLSNELTHWSTSINKFTGLQFKPFLNTVVIIAILPGKDNTRRERKSNATQRWEDKEVPIHWKYDADLCDIHFSCFDIDINIVVASVSNSISISIFWRPLFRIQYQYQYSCGLCFEFEIDINILVASVSNSISISIFC